MMDVRYHSLYNMIFFLGISEFFFNLISFSILLVNKFENNNYDKLKSIEKYDKSQIGNITLKFLIGLFCNGFLYSILEFQTIHLFNPNHIFVC